MKLTQVKACLAGLILITFLYLLSLAPSDPEEEWNGPIPIESVVHITTNYVATNYVPLKARAPFEEWPSFIFEKAWAEYQRLSDRLAIDLAIPDLLAMTPAEAQAWLADPTITAARDAAQEELFAYARWIEWNWPKEWAEATKDWPQALTPERIEDQE